MASRPEWRRDPSGRHGHRWWDGDQFTEYVGDDGVQSVDPGPVPAATPTIEVGFAPPARQNRWTVGFRIILAIPVLLWFAVLSIAAAAVVVVGWFAALFTGRLPHGMADFLSRVLRYGVMVRAYMYLLHDRFPGFALDRDRREVTVETSPGPLNRAAVLFRLILLIPVYLLTSWLLAGMGLAMLVIWVIVLVRGEVPPTIAQAVGAVLRFEARTVGFAMMLSSEYPRGLYGDRGSALVALPRDVPAPPTMAAPGVTQHVLTTGARRLITVFLVLGILTSITSNVLDSSSSGNALGVPAHGTHTVP